MVILALIFMYGGKWEVWDRYTIPPDEAVCLVRDESLTDLDQLEVACIR